MQLNDGVMAPGTRERMIARENALRAARNSGTAVASAEYVNGVPMPHTTGAMAPTGIQPALFSLANYIRAGFKFVGGGINEPDYARQYFSNVFNDWNRRFGMPLNWSTGTPAATTAVQPAPTVTDTKAEITVSTLAPVTTTTAAASTTTATGESTSPPVVYYQPYTVTDYYGATSTESDAAPAASGFKLSPGLILAALSFLIFKG